MNIHLSKRLTLAASFVPNGAVLADIGSDHGYLPISLVQEGRIKKAEAVENKKGPYSRLVQDVKEAGLEESIHCVYADGIASLDQNVDTLTLLGMGGLLIASILEAHSENLGNIDTIVIDAHRDLDELRRRVNALGYHINEEEMVYEDGIFYTIIRFKKGSLSELSKRELTLGPIMSKKRGETYEAWRKEQEKRLLLLLEKPLSDQARQSYEEKLSLFKEED